MIFSASRSCSNTLSAASVVPPFEVTCLLSSPGGSADCAASFAAPSTICMASFSEVCFSSPSFSPEAASCSMNQNTYAGPLVLHPDHLADGAQNGFGLLPFLRVHFGQRVERGDPRADQRRRVGHASNELAVPPEPARQRIDAHAGGDADHELFTRFSGQASECRFHVLGLHGKDQDVRRGGARIGRGACVNLVLGCEPLACRSRNLDRADGSG